MNEIESASASREQKMPLPSTYTNGKDTTETLPAKRLNKTPVAGVATPILVSEQQFQTVREEHSVSMSLLNDSGKALLDTLQRMAPPEGSGRIAGEYTAQGMRQIAKSICDLVHTKNNVIRSMYQIARDEI